MTIEGFVEHIIYRNAENAYTVMELNTGDGNELTLVGIFSVIDEGDYLEAEGEMVQHPSYGLQLKVSSYSMKMPEDSDSMLIYLASGAISGIREALAKRIVKKFGDDTFRIMSEEPERLAEIKGISINKAQQISASFAEKAGMRQAMMFLQKYGISNIMAVRVYEKYHDKMYGIIEENPYRMCEDIPGIGFKKADEIAERAGIERHSPFRVRAGILFVLKNASNEGNVYILEEELLEKTASILAVERDEVDASLSQLAIEREVICRKNDEGTAVYLASYYNMEIECAKLLNDLDLRIELPEDEISSAIKVIEKKTSLTLEDNQKSAVIKAIGNGVFIMTGGPGTGKTTTLKVLLNFYTTAGMSVMLAAPTGRAARRMSEATGMSARTIHRMLEVTGGAGDGESARIFQRNSENPLETDVVVIDEMSMVDLPLFRSLLRAIAPGTRLIMVGDEHQLPSVGPGSVLKDLIASGQFEMVTLKKIFRQAGESDIVMNAHAILDGKIPEMDNKSRDFYFLSRTDAEEIIQGVIYLVSKKLPPYVKANPMEIQVMTPMKKGLLGVEAMNRRLQEALNPPHRGKIEKNLGNWVIREGDKVMQTRNNYQLEWEMEKEDSPLQESGSGVFNGDMGIVTSIDPSFGDINVLFDDGRKVKYPSASAGELELAYAITIHKSQGSEYPAVVLPLLSGPEILMTRNLIYTAITRAKSCVVIIGRKRTVEDMIMNTNEQKRYTSLAERIKEIFEKMRS
ncbi:MAG: ATP-dependent RecD-like DNA helicase [Lachnospiraceae bacterium]|nr:ATP-dependent RecD-like DNA helicase [Lachnospiraceae bacterium]